MLGIDRLTPDNVNLNDMDVWRSIRDDTTLIFQWESAGSSQYLKRFMSDATLAIASERIPNFSMIKWMSFGNGLIRPACASFRDSVANGEFYDNGLKELNDFLAPEAGRIAMQETIMQFLVRFCGYSNAESDSVRRGIAKKKGTEKLLPEIERRFIEYTSANYGISQEKCAEVIKPFIQVILDASAYAFSWNHSDSYSIIGYICGYLRYYHPMEFLTAALNTFQDNAEKTNAITKYAEKHKIRITTPKYGYSKGDYFYSEKDKVIAKGLCSVKFMSRQIADELYLISQEKKYDHFVDLLSDLNAKTSLNSRQLDILIKLDFFSDFGNQRELLRITDLFADLFKSGEVRKISRDRVDGTPLEAVVQKYSVGTTKAGGMAKAYTMLDVESAMREAEDAVKAVHMEDLPLLTKVHNFNDIMGYAGYTTGREEDRRKLYVSEVYPICRKSDGKQFGYSITTKSIGSGRDGRFSVFNAVWNKNPIKKGDIILCISYLTEGKYFRLTEYEKIY